MMAPVAGSSRLPASSRASHSMRVFLGRLLRVLVLAGVAGAAVAGLAWWRRSAPGPDAAAFREAEVVREDFRLSMAGTGTLEPEEVVDVGAQVAGIIREFGRVADADKPVDAEVLGYDPESALFGGPDGLRDIRVFIARAARLLRAGGTLVVEHADGQGAAVRGIAAEAGFGMTTTHTDLLHRERALTAVR